MTLEDILKGNHKPKYNDQIIEDLSKNTIWEKTTEILDMGLQYKSEVPSAKFIISNKEIENIKDWMWSMDNESKYNLLRSLKLKFIEKYKTSNNIEVEDKALHYLISFFNRIDDTFIRKADLEKWGENVKPIIK
jgi:hypothetical protein